jgi:hypothetical protein
MKTIGIILSCVSFLTLLSVLAIAKPHYPKHKPKHSHLKNHHEFHRHHTMDMKKDWVYKQIQINK